MKLWRVERTDLVDYDEYDAFVVRARNAEHAVCLIWAAHGPHPNRHNPAVMVGGRALGRPVTLDAFRARVKVEPLPARGEPGIILDSYIAG